MIDGDAVRGEIIDAHVAIERWFTGEAEPDGLEALMARFAADFRMVSPAGAVLDKPAIRALFGRLHGARPNVRITIDDVRIHAVGPDHALATYREDQVDAAGQHTGRLSTALFEADEGALLWRLLHETWLPAAKGT